MTTSSQLGSIQWNPEEVLISAGGATGPLGPDTGPLWPLSPQGSPPRVLAPLLLRVRPGAPTPRAWLLSSPFPAPVEAQAPKA